MPRGVPLQIAYVTRDLDRACALFSSRHNVGAYYRPDAPTHLINDADEPMSMRLAHAWWGPMWLEIIEPLDGAVALYRDWLRSGEDVRLHHLGIRVDTREALAHAQREQVEAGRRIVFSVTRAGGSNLFYADTTTEFGHYTEYLFFPNPEASTLARIPK